MRALRRRPCLACFTLIALAMQAMLALAHTHTHTPLRTHPAGLESRAITFGVCTAKSEQPCPAPVRHDDDSHCGACWLIGLASSGVLHPPPALPRHVQPYAPLRSIRAATVLHREVVALFQARAPPFA